MESLKFNFNVQVAETHRVKNLAEMVASKTGASIDFVSNPRNEAAENELKVDNDKFGNLGVNFKSLDASLMEEVNDIAQRYRHRGDLDMIYPKVCHMFIQFICCYSYKTHDVSSTQPPSWLTRIFC